MKDQHDKTGSDHSTNVTCNFRYTGCYLLVIISDGSDALRQQEIVKALGLLNDSNESLHDWNLDRFDAEWSHRFIEHALHLVGNGKLNRNFLKRMLQKPFPVEMNHFFSTNAAFRSHRSYSSMFEIMLPEKKLK